MKRYLEIVLVGIAGLVLPGCRGQRQDTVLTWAESPSHTWRAAVVQREYFIDGHPDDAPTTYVLLDAADGPPNYENGQSFKESQVVMKPSRCGPLSLQWTSDTALQVTCEKCGLALAEAGRHATGMGAIRVDYVDFPERSSWEAGSGQE